jgi:hypothetical protein
VVRTGDNVLKKLRYQRNIPKRDLLTSDYWLLTSGRWIAGGLVLVLSACSPSDTSCSNEILHQDVSPNGTNKAVVFLRHCPGQKDCINVSILKASDSLPDGNGNIFVDPEKIAVRTVWASDQSLQLLTLKSPADAVRLNRVGNIAIEYVTAMDADIVVPEKSQPSAAKGQ